MALVSRVSLSGPPADSPEDFFANSLGVIFQDDITNQHGDHDHGLIYASPHLPCPLHLALSDPTADVDRRLFSHYLWNAALQLAELVEAGTLGLPYPHDPTLSAPASDFDVAGLATLELGAGTALPSLMSALLGAARTVVTDYPAPVVIETLRSNVARNTRPELSPKGIQGCAQVLVEGHGWGELESPLATQNHHAFDRVYVADCMWMPWQHANLHRSIAWFLKEGEQSRCWAIAGFHTGRERMKGFFDEKALAKEGLELERIWERDCDGIERAWVEEREGGDDVTVRKRWLVIGIIRRKGLVPSGSSAVVVNETDGR